MSDSAGKWPEEASLEIGSATKKGRDTNDSVTGGGYDYDAIANDELPPNRHDLLEAINLGDAVLKQKARSKPRSEEGNEEQSLIGKLLKAAERFPNLTREQEQDLGKLSLEGENDDIKAAARLKLVQHNIRLVISVAKKECWRAPHLPFADLVQEGFFGLMRAAEKFEYHRGVRFSTYAVWWVKQAVKRGISGQSHLIHRSIDAVKDTNKIMMTIRAMTNELNRDPTPKEIAARLNIKITKVRELLLISLHPLSFETPIGKDSKNTLGNYISNNGAEVVECPTDNNQLRARLNDVLADLRPREEKIMRLRFGLPCEGYPKLRAPMSFEEISKEFGLTRERIRQIEAQALGKLRHPTRKRQLKDFTE
ncbi:MAG: sigma-70 family RNA polymerase sigma factor [Candidatus Peregrinibacteria bacterium]|nr:sigma-70 family RNA polymerase sigma factor [Candidatus Peregrinibacteria bacterium]MDZ4245160.1 sigma-70 family RNA polymerase sigma factor [Candidatus Gracilibacteria bacterium]